MPQSLDNYDQNLTGDRGVLVLESSEQQPATGRKNNNDSMTVHNGMGAGSMTGPSLAPPMRHEKKQSQSVPSAGMASNGAMVPIMTGMHGQGGIAAEFVPRLNMHYDGQQQQQQGYLQQQQQGGHQQYQSYVPYPANNQAYIHGQQQQQQQQQWR